MYKFCGSQIELNVPPTPLQISFYTVEPPNRGYYGANGFVPCKGVVPILEVIVHKTIVLCIEVISECPLSEVPLYHPYNMPSVCVLL